MPNCIREYATHAAHEYEGTITYHLGYIKLNEVAVQNADVVCPEGNEGV
jgi:hypothetical protein